MQNTIIYIPSKVISLYVRCFCATYAVPFIPKLLEYENTGMITYKFIGIID